MADPYIDNFEIGEYSAHLLTQLPSLVGASPVIDIEALRTIVGDSADRVRQELLRLGVSQSDLRSGRTDTTGAAELARRRLRQYRSYLLTLEGDVPVDTEAFFPKRKGGGLNRLKPADLLAYLEGTLRGFDTPAASALPERETWQARLTEARDNLAAAVGGKGAARITSVRGTSELAAARRSFLHDYNFAKSVVRAILKLQGRESELRLFFLDLQVNESARPKAEDAPIDEGDEDADEGDPGDPGDEDADDVSDYGQA